MSKSVKTIILILGHGLNVLVNFLFLPYLSRALPIEEYGRYGQTLLITDLVKVLVSMGLATILFVYLADEKRNKGNVYKSNLFNAMVLGFIGFVLVFMSAPFCSEIFNGGPELEKYIKINSLTLLFAIPFLTADSALVFMDRIKRSMLILLITNLLKLILLVLAIQILGSLEMVFWSLVIASAVQLFWAHFSVPAELRKAYLHFKLGWLQIKDGFYLGFSKVLNVFLIYTDSFMVGAMLDVEDYAIFRNGAIEIPFLSIIYASVSTVLFPEISKMFSNNQMDEIASMKRKSTNSSAAIIYPPLIFLLLFSTPIISLYLSSKYAASGMVFSIYNLIVFFRINSYHEIISNSNRKYLLSRAYFLCLLGNLALNYVMISSWGYIGAAISSVISIAGLLLYLSFLSAKIIGKRITDIFDFRTLFKLLLPPLLLGVVFFVLYQFYSAFWLLPLIAVLVILISYWIYWKRNWIDKVLVNDLLVKIPFVGTTIKKKLN